MAEPTHGHPEPSPHALARSVFVLTVAGTVLTIGIVLFFVLFGGGAGAVAELVPSASSFAPGIDFVIMLVAVLVGFWFFAVLGTFFWMIWRFRAGRQPKAEYLAVHDDLLHRWVSWPHFLVILCDVLIIAAAVRVWYNVKIAMPDPDYTIGVIGQQWAWTFVQPGKDGRIDVPDEIRTVDRLHVMVDKTYEFELSSKDVVHSFSVPVFRLKQDAVPGRVIRGWFRPTEVGTYDIQCTQMCGIGHGLMGAQIVVDTPQQYQTFLNTHTPNPPATLTAAATQSTQL